MLGSITPLGERGRGSRWGVTVTAYLAGSIVAGGTSTALAGWVGQQLWPMDDGGSPARLAMLTGLILLGVALDARLFGLRLPTVRRQVNEDWLNRYRGWVYGIAFGFQLGLGVATIVSTAAVYLMFFAALLSGSLVAGAVIGTVFGLVRGATILGAARVHGPADVLGMGTRLRRWERVSLQLSTGVQLALAGVVLATLW